MTSGDEEICKDCDEEEVEDVTTFCYTSLHG